MNEHRLIDRLRSMPKMTPSEAKIADFFVREHQQIAFETVTSIADKCGVSKATVARFIARLGYDSFNEFQELIQREFLDRIQSPIERYSKKKTPGRKIDYLERSLVTAQRNLEETRSRVSPDDFWKAADLLAHAPGGLYVMGMLSSFGPASFFYLMANYLRPRVHLLDNNFSTLPNQLINVGPDDVLLSISHRRYSRQSALAMEYFVDQGGRVVLITDSELSPVVHLAEIVLVVPGSGIVMFDSNCAKLAVIEALAEALAEKLEKTLFDRFEVMDRIFKKFGTFSPGPDHSLSERMTRKD